ncbi:GNAT family N-acetyltransferase [Kribbella sp. WER1]
MTEVVLPLTIRPLTEADLPNCGWYGTPTDLAYLTEAIHRAHRGEVDYLAICPPSARPIAVGGIDYTKPPDAATLWQLAVHPDLRGCGIGTTLITALEHQARKRGLTWVELGVDNNNPRPRALYERLGYQPTTTEPASWNQQSPDGTITRYQTQITLMRRQLAR